MVTSSSDVPMKGLVPLLEAVAKLRTERDVELDGHRPAPRGRPGRPGHRPPGPRATSCTASAASATTSWPASTARPRWRWCPRSTRGSRCRPSRPWPAGSPSWPPPAARCPRWSGPTARPACWSPPDDPGALAGAIGRLLDDPELRAAPRRGRARSGSSAASPGRSPRPARPHCYEACSRAGRCPARPAAATVAREWRRC